MQNCQPNRNCILTAAHADVVGVLDTIAGRENVSIHTADIHAVSVDGGIK